MQKNQKNKNYFNKETEKAIEAFQKESDPEKREEIFRKEIFPAFHKLIENITFIYKFNTISNVDILMHECMSFLFENIHKFDGTRGFKAFSYFNVIAKNWFIQRVKTNKEKMKKNVSFDEVLLDTLEDSSNENVVFSYDDFFFKNEFFELLKEESKTWRKKFKKNHETKVLEAVILLLENTELISIYNKKGIYLYLREITGLKTEQVAANLAKLRKKYDIFKKLYNEGRI